MAQATHKLVADTAKEMAEAAYEAMAFDNHFYTANPNRRSWVRAHFGEFIPDARQALAHMLGLEEVPENQKEIIFEALRLDNSVKGKRAKTV